MAAVQSDKLEVNGVIIEALPDTIFNVELEDGRVQIAYLSGKMRYNKIRVLVGDRVRVLMDPYGGKGRIVRRI